MGVPGLLCVGLNRCNLNLRPAQAQPNGVGVPGLLCVGLDSLTLRPAQIQPNGVGVPGLLYVGLGINARTGGATAVHNSTWATRPVWGRHYHTLNVVVGVGSPDLTSPAPLGW